MDKTAHAKSPSDWTLIGRLSRACGSTWLQAKVETDGGLAVIASVIPMFPAILWNLARFTATRDRSTIVPGPSLFTILLRSHSLSTTLHHPSNTTQRLTVLLTLKTGPPHQQSTWSTGVQIRQAHPRDSGSAIHTRLARVHRSDNHLVSLIITFFSSPVLNLPSTPSPAPPRRPRHRPRAPRRLPPSSSIPRHSHPYHYNQA